jgi:3-deoxy-7-phosphoheptulonate synthase
MLVVMNASATAAEIAAVEAKIRALGYTPHAIPGPTRTAIGITGNKGTDGRDALRLMPGVADVIRVSAPYKLVSRETNPTPMSFEVAHTQIGPGGLTIMAGPCSVENEDMVFRTADFLMGLGVRLMRGGAYKPRTSPYSFQGLREEGLRILERARDRTGIGIVTEVIDVESCDEVEKACDLLQVGTRNMQNYALLRRLSRAGKPVMLKRGMAATLEEWLMAAEYIAAGGNRKIVLCERGVRTFSDHTRNTLDLSIVPVAKSITYLPVIADPSHGTGKAQFVPAMSRAALAAGADGLLIEMHPDPQNALSDGAQSLDFESFAGLLQSLRPLADAMGVAIR